MNKKLISKKNKTLKILLASGVIAAPLLVSYQVDAAEVTVKDGELRAVENNFLIIPDAGKEIKPIVTVTGVTPKSVTKPTNNEYQTADYYMEKNENFDSHTFRRFQDGFGGTSIRLDQATSEKAVITVLYKQQATYKGEPVDVKMTFSNIKGETNPSAGEMKDVGFMISDNMFSGYYYLNARDFDVNVEFIKKDGSKVVFNNDAYFTFNSLNYYEGNPNVTSLYKNESSEYVGYKNQDPSSDTYLTADTNVKSMTVDGKKVYGGTVGEFTDKLGGETFKRNTVSFQVKGDSLDFAVGTTNRYGAWNSISSSTLFDVAPKKPYKTVTDSDEVNKTMNTFETGEVLTFKVNQPTQTLGVDALQRYSQFAIVDNLPKNTTYVEGSARLLDSTGKAVSVSPTSFTYSKDTHTLMFNGDAEFLNTMNMDGKNYTIEFKAKPIDGLKEGDVVDNVAKSIINKAEYPTNHTVSKTHIPTASTVKKMVDAKIPVNGGVPTVEEGTAFNYFVDYTITDSKLNNRLVLTDDLEDVLDAKAIKVLDEKGTDITSKGTVNVDDAKELITWTAKTPSEFAGQKLKMQVTAVLKTKADLTPYTKEGKIEIPNVAKLTTKEGVKSSNPVVVKPVLKYTLGDSVWNDINKDGKQDTTEKGIPGAKVEVKDKDGKVVATTTTDKDGKYVVKGLPAGDYTVDFTPPKEYTPVDKSKLSQTIKLDKDNMDADLGLLIPTPPPAPKDPTKTVVDKSVLDTNDKEVDATEVKKATDYKYHVSTTVTDKKDIKSLEIQDDLEDVLEAKSAKVLDKDGKDITAEGTLTIDEEKEIITWKAKEPAKYSSQKLLLEVVAQVKKDANLSKYADKDGNIIIPNTANVIVDGTTTPSDKVDVTVLKDPSKTVVKKSASDDTLEVGQSYSYSVETTVTDDKNVKEVTLIDDLEDVLEAKTAKVLDKDGKDITAEGILTIDEEKEIITWKAKDGSKYVGQKLTLAIDTFIKKDADLSKYTSEDGKVVIPNTAKTIVGIDKDGKIVEEEIESNKVDVTTTPKAEEPTTEEPTTEEPTSEEPTTEAPTTERPESVVVPTTTETPSVEKIEKPKTQSILPHTGSKSLDFLLYAGAAISLFGAVGYFVCRKKFSEE
ncbi:isopeptide-forming domain-containing fimbrial protein (plasmid) [Macrococcus psychrotolerans]|uniref:Isopeptide-forming domain-containing fimbrial protein n=1 Tax=Macrococcus psychrotolerans TaxID=3039389 RepID=A0AAT9PAZ7_9STAP|nr:MULTISPECIES: isopeptide-forming domain-containing fimbrial protein [Macrococcus]QYA34163.1 isopeptide-forming domain-containing fimbrial protein [Macrococcus sp. 19Msa1099]QYA38964.1 isopeptide-forming domain-containing fimbrial protein [Macrococcus caseolyticus]QYA77674.1 isopeptide-forming domain-containing fimbrial protein [Macrococcus caseolyticus]